MHQPLVLHLKLTYGVCKEYLNRAGEKSITVTEK